MEKIKFIKKDTIIDATLSIAGNVVKIVSDNLPSEKIILSGFQLLNEHNLSVMGDFSNYNTKYKEADEENTFYLSNGEVYVDPVIPDPIPEHEPEPEPELTEEEIVAQKQELFNKTKEEKIAEMSNVCNYSIEFGVFYNEKQYSYTIQDQSNMLNAMTLAKETGQKVPYHANGESCELYSYEDLVAVYIAEMMNLTQNQTYFNQLKLYIMSVDDIEMTDEIKGITYGQELTGEFLEKYNEIITQSSAIMNAFIVANNKDESTDSTEGSSTETDSDNTVVDNDNENTDVVDDIGGETP